MKYNYSPEEVDALCKENNWSYEDFWEECDYRVANGEFEQHGNFLLQVYEGDAGEYNVHIYKVLQGVTRITGEPYVERTRG